MPRIFIAVPFSAEWKEELALTMGRWREEGVRGRFVRADNLHLTLAFIGFCDRPGDVLEVLRSVPFEAFELRLQGCGAFESVLWAGIAENEELARYVAKLRAALTKAGFPVDGKPFHPHITLVRRPRYDKLPSFMPEGSVMRAERVCLMQTVSTDGGVRYLEIGARAAGKKEGGGSGEE